MVTRSSPIDGHGNEDRDLELNSVLIGGAIGKNSLICVAKQMSCCYGLLGLLQRMKSHLCLLFITLGLSRFPELLSNSTLKNVNFIYLLSADTCRIFLL